MAAKRNYKNEYAKFHSSPKAIKDRAARNKARKNALKVGKVIKEKSRKKGSKRNYPKTRKKAK